MDNTTNYNLSGITYDQNGNITKLLRKGHTNESATTFGNMDNLTYDYDSGNRLLSVTDAVATPTLMKGEFKDGNKTGNDYNYDDNGNLVQDLNKGIPSNGITYNHLNLPSSITTTNGNISYIYDALGTKIQKRVTEGSSVTSITDYAGNYIYENGDLQFFSHPEGYVNAEGSGYKYVYQYKDHLGNIRLSYQDADNNGSITANEIVEESNYYPFGLDHKGYNNMVNGTEYNYKTFQGQEINKELDLNWLSFKYRNYDPAIGRFMRVDPLAEGFPSWSPYSFSFNNPVRYIDLLGLAPLDVIISGSEKEAALKQLQASVQGELTLSMNDNGKVSYTQNGDGKLSKDAQQLVTAIDDHSIVVNVNAENTTTTESGNLYIGGAFSGNTVTQGENGNTVSTKQEVNPNVLGKASNAHGKPGADILHEVTESYQGGLISQKKGVSSPAAGQKGSVYDKAHRGATSQSGSIFERIYDGSGNELQKLPGNIYPSGVKSADWYVNDKKGNKVIIQKLN